MDLSRLMQALETAPARIKTLEADIAERTRAKDALIAFSRAVAGLKEDWNDSDPGKYGAHWHGFKGGEKAWPEELVDKAAVAKSGRRVQLAPLASLDQANCPGCRHLALMVCRYQQTEDGPFGDTWTKTRYALCVGCVGLFQLGQPQVSSHRF